MAVGLQEEVPCESTQYVEWALEKAGGSGPFQYKYLVGLGLAWAYVASLCYIGLFAGTPPHIRPAHCEGGKCASIALDCMSPKKEWLYESEVNSYVATFDLVCDRSRLAPLLPSLFFFGSAFGAVAGGSLSDQFGRRRAWLAFLVVMQLGVLGQVVAQDYMQYAAAIFLTGFGSSAWGLISYVWNTEMLGQGLRSVMTWSPNVFFSLGQMFLSVLAMNLPQWRHLTLAEFVLGCGFFLIVLFLEESPKWLASQGRLDDAHVVLSSCARANGQVAPPPPLANEYPRAPEDSAACEKNLASPGAWQLLDRRLFSRFTIMCFAWFATSMGYYGLSFNAASLPLDVYMANIVSGATCIPAYLAAGFLVDWPWCGRRGAVAGGFLVSGLCLLLSSQGSEFSLLVLYYVAMSAVSLAFAVIYVWGSELFPTDIRGNAMGLQSVAARVGAVMAPVVVSMGDKSHPTLPLILFATPCLMAGFFALTLPETRGRPLLGTIADLDKEAKGSGFAGAEPLKEKANSSKSRRRSQSPATMD